MIAHPQLRMSLEQFHGLAGRLAPRFGWSAAALVAVGLGAALLPAAGSAAHAEAMRIAAIHYPAQWISLAIYVAIGALSALTLRERSRLAAMLAHALAPTGILFTLLTLWTGALWRKPLRGVWWTWDAESVSQLMLLMLLGGFIAVRAMIDDPRRADRACSLVAVVGLANLPVLYFSLRWWDITRHEVAAAAVPELTVAALGAALLVGAGFVAHTAFVALKRARCLIAERTALARSLRGLLESHA